MDGSDDYFTDDIVFDEQALAVLENEEQKYLTQRTVLSRPPTKRQKTETGWNVGLGNRDGSQDAIEDLPEISVRADGSYGVTPAVPPTVSSHVSVAPVWNSVTRPSALRYSTVIPPNVPSTSRNVSVSEAHLSTLSRTPSLSQRRPNVIQKPHVPSGKGRGSVVHSRATSLAPASVSTSPNAVGHSHLLQQQVEELQQQLAKVVFIILDTYSKLDASIG